MIFPISVCSSNFLFSSYFLESEVLKRAEKVVSLECHV